MLLVDDAVSSGTAVARFTAALTEEGAEVVGVFVLVDMREVVEAFRPGGVKVRVGAPVLEQGMVEEDFKELAAAGVKFLGEVGLGSVKDGTTGQRMVAWARKYGIQSTIHTGGPSIPGSSLIRQRHGARNGCRRDRPR